MSKKVSTLVGSLRKGSLVRKITQNIISTFPGSYETQIVGIGHLPLHNFDYDDPAVIDLLTPFSYTELRETIKASAGVLFVASEDNRTVSACLKNAADIGSKPDVGVAWRKTPAGTISHSVGKMGGHSAQKNLCPVLSYLDMSLTGQPEMFLGNSPTLFDDNGRLIESVREFVQGYIDQLVALIEKSPKQSGLKHIGRLKAEFQTASLFAKNQFFNPS